MKYYTVCEFSESYTSQLRYNTRLSVYPRPVLGFVFHDTETSLQINEILRPLYVLSELFVDKEKTTDTALLPAIITRLNQNTLAATFSTKGFPHPMRRDKLPHTSRWLDGVEWLENRQLTGWIVPNVIDSSKPPVPVNFNDFYEDCTELSRFTNHCPCNLLESGECFERQVLPKLSPELVELFKNRSDYSFDTKPFRLKRFSTIAGFDYVSPKTTLYDDFESSFRPYDDHDFDAVPQRQDELKKRGKIRHFRETYRKDTCGQCAFARYDPQRDKITDCGGIDRCDSHTSESEAWTMLYKWYAESGFEHIPGFTQKQQDYLARHAGTVYKAKIFSEHRRTKVRLSGFYKRRDSAYSSYVWVYQVSPASGDLRRCKIYLNYDELRGDIPELPEEPETDPLDSKEKLFCAILGSHEGLTSTYAGIHTPYCVRVTSRGVYSIGAITSDTPTSLHLHFDGSAKQVYTALFGPQYTRAKKAPDKLLPIRVGYGV